MLVLMMTGNCCSVMLILLLVQMFFGGRTHGHDGTMIKLLSQSALPLLGHDF